MILFIIPTDIMAAYDPDNLRLIIIRIDIFVVDIVMIKHNRDEYPVIDQNTEIYNSSFQVTFNCVNELYEMRILLMRVIFDLYPNNVLLSDDIMAWNLSPEESVDQVRQKIIRKLTPIPYFNGSISLRPPFVEGMSLIEENLERSLTIWGFHATVKASVFSLKCKVLNFISKFFQDKVLADDETEYFLRENPDDDLISSVVNLNFFNVLVLMDYEKRPLFRTRYHAKIQQLPLPQLFLKKLEDYCPSDDYIGTPFYF